VYILYFFRYNQILLEFFIPSPLFDILAEGETHQKPCVGLGSCRPDLFRGWMVKRQHEAGFSFVRFSFAHVCSFHCLGFCVVSWL